MDASNGNYQLSAGSPSEASGENGAKMGYEGDFDLSNLVYSPETITYNWSTGESSQNITISPTESTTYGIDVGSGSNACSESITVVVFPHLKDSICANELYDFHGALLSDAGVYIDTLTDVNGQDSLVKLTLTVLDIPDVFAGEDTLICDNEGVILTASGSVVESYQWNNNITDGFEFFPDVGSESYIVTGTDSLGCSNFDTTVVVVSALPEVDAGNNQSVCLGDQVTLSGSGALIYNWSNGVNDGVPFIPDLGSQVYSVFGTDVNGCLNSDNVLVEVIEYVNSEFTQIDPVCYGSIIQLPNTSNNGFVGNWSPTFNSTATTNYTFTSDLGQCGNSTQMTIEINPLPNVNAGSDLEVCEGTGVILNGSGALTYLWNNGVENGVQFIPNIGTTLYTVEGTDANGCVNSDQLTIDVNQLPFLYAGVDQEICEGNDVTLSANGTGPFSWTGGILDGVPFTPLLGSTNYTVSVTDNNGCFNSDDVQVTLHPSPLVDAGVDQVICEGESISLYGSGADIYEWSDGIIDGEPFQPVPGIFQYSVIGTNEYGGTDSLLTTMTDNNGGQSNMFAISAIQETTISDFAMNLDAGTANSIEVYYRTDNYLVVPGSNTNSAGWIFIGAASNIVTAGSVNPTEIPIPVNIMIPAGETYSFHINVVGAGVNYTNGTGLGNVFASNSSLEFLEGHGGSGLFNCTFQPRVWNGIIFYGGGNSDFSCSDSDIVQVTVDPVVYGIDEQTACDSFTWIDGNSYTESNYTATHILTNVNGCDSIVTLDLTVNYQSDTTLYVSSLGDYNLNGETYTESGTYQQIIQNQFGCDSTIILNLNMEESSLGELSELGISVYPNPFWSEINVELKDCDRIIYISIIDVRGRIVMNKRTLSKENRFGMSSLHSGVYYLNVYEESRIIGRIKVIKR